MLYMVTRLSSENVCGLWKFSQMFRLADLETATFRFLCENFSDVCLQEEFSNLCYDDLGRVFTCFDLGQARQENLWLALVTWSTEQQDQAHQVQELSKHIIYNLMEESFIREQVLKSSIYRFLDKDWASELLFLFGGDFSESRRIVSYNSDTDRWRKLPLELPDPLQAPGDHVQAVHCSQGVFFKRSICCYWLDIHTFLFHSVGKLEKRMPAITVLNGEVHLLGGSYLTTWEVYNPRTRRWRNMWPNLRLGRVYACAAVVRGVIFVLGGQTIDNKDGVADCEMFDRVRQCWVQIPGMQVPRTLFACVVLEGEIYVLGGQTGGGKTGQCEKYNPVTGCWTRLPDMIVPRRGHVAVVLEQVVFVIGGETERAEWLDMEGGSWVETRSLPSSLTGAGGCVVNIDGGCKYESI